MATDLGRGLRGRGTQKIVLVGMMGSGKTTIGRRLARRLGRPFLDSDDAIEEATGRTVREIWETQGEPAFRALERRALREALAEPRPTVVAAAGGVVLDAENRRLLRSAGRVIWLRADPGLLVRRVDAGGHRPLLEDDPEGTLRRLDRERRWLYREVADEVIDVDRLQPDAVVERIVA